MDMVWLRCALNWSCYDLWSLAAWWPGAHCSQHGAFSLLLPLHCCRHQLPAPSGHGDLCPPAQTMLEKSCEAPRALRGAGHSGNL